MKRKNLVVTVLVSLVTVLLSTSVNAQSIRAKQQTAEFDKILAEQFKPDGTGCAILVARDGEVIYRKAFGLADLELNVVMRPEMVFRIGSITKQFTAIAILRLMEQGKLSLRDEITKYMPDYPTHGHSITIEHLLTHTSGIKSYTNIPEFQAMMRTDMTPLEIIEKNKALPMEFAPGTRWNYNNTGYIMLGYIIEKVSGKTYAEYLQENFFTPLGMTSSYYGDDTRIIRNRASGYQPGKEGTVNADYLSMTLPYAAGSIMSTVDDLYKWNRALHSYKLVKKETLDKAHTVYILSDGKPTSYGYGWFMSELQGSPTIEHDGGINGFLTTSLYLPDQDLFVALFSNNNGIDPGFPALKIAAAAIGKPLETGAIEIDNETLDAYPGVYREDEGITRVIIREDNQLYSQREGSTRLRIMPVAKDRFRFENSFTTITFTRSEKGDVTGFVMDTRGISTNSKKTNDPLPERKEITVSEELLSKYVGEYEIQPGFVIAFTLEGNRLMTQATGQQQFEVFAESETKFFLRVVDAQVEFVADPDGKFNKMILYQGGQKIEGKRIK